MFPRVIVPLDGSARAEAALPQARRLLKRGDAEAIVVRAVNFYPMADVDAMLIARLREEADAYVRDTAARLQGEGIRARGVTRIGSPAGVILEVAAEERASLIAMSTHGRTGLARWVMGSVAEKVLRASPVPVLAVRSFEPDLRPAGEAERPIRKILVPVDGSAYSLAILPYAESLARIFEAGIVLVHAFEPQWNFAPDEIKIAHEKLTKAGVAVETHVREGDPASAILEACRELSAGLIAMTTHGRSGATRWVLGSVAEKVLRAAVVPLFVVRTGTA